MTKKSEMTSSNIAISSQKNWTFLDAITSILYFDFSYFTKKRVAILKLSGVIGKGGSIGSKGMSLDILNPLIEKAFGYSGLEAVCLSINSPGGSPVQSELIAARIIALSKEKKIPVYSFVEDVAASGGYWLACAGEEIFASKSSIVGSIGVISAGFGLVDAIAKLGIERRVITSGKNKSVLDPFSKSKDTDVKLIQNIQSHIHKHFISYVQSRRSGKMTQDDDVLFNGEFWDGESAKDLGLIDDIDDMYSFIRRNFGSKVKIENVSVKESWIKKQIGIFADIFSSSLSSAVAAEVKNSGKELHLESKYNLD